MRKNYKLEELQIDSMYLEQAQSYKYPESTVNRDNSIKVEIQYRITLGSKAYYANQFLFKSKLISKKSKLKLYWSIIRPTVTYGCEVWVLKETIKNKLMVFERKVLRSLVL
jgi:predicted porin